jgi:YbdK family carboxylate-amine ligase
VELAGVVSRDPEPAPPPVAASAGVTFGVEEEFHLVDPVTYRLTRSPDLAEAVMRHESGRHLHAEITTTQLESATDVCRSLSDLRAELVTTRAEAAGAAARAGVRILAASTHPFDSWHDQDITPAPRYTAMVDRWAGLAVHVGVPDLETAVAIMDRARPYLPVLLAMTGSSPFHDGVDTGHASYRTMWWSRWPTTGPPEYLGSAERFHEVVTGLVASGVVADASHLYWDLRPSYHLPTLEFRLADVCTEVDDVVLHAALVRSLVRVLAARAERGETCPRPRAELLRAARWRAARHGLEGELFDAVTRELVPARVAVRRLLGELRGDLRDHDEWDVVVELVERLFVRGTSATRQRRTWLRTGDWREVAARIVREGTALEN